MLSYKIWDSLNESAKNEYRYITNHGIGPGTLPNNVYVHSEDLENGKTAIYTNRPLSDEELKKYDIKPEWVQEGTYEETDESNNLKEDAWSDNFVIAIIQKDGVYWERKSDGKIIKTSLDVFDEPTDPTEWKSEEELDKYKIGEGLKEDGYKSDSMKYNFNDNYVDISALRKYSSYLDSISSVLDDSDYSDVYADLSSDKFSNALESFIDALVDENVRIDSEMKSIENNLVNKK